MEELEAIRQQEHLEDILPPILFMKISSVSKLSSFAQKSETAIHLDFYLVKVPEGMDLDKTAPILCAGITMYSPLKYWGAAGKDRKTVGIIGIGNDFLTFQFDKIMTILDFQVD